MKSVVVQHSRPHYCGVYFDRHPFDEPYEVLSQIAGEVTKISTMSNMVENHVVYVVVFGSEVVSQYASPQCISCHLVPAGSVEHVVADGKLAGRDWENSPPVSVACIGENGRKLAYVKSMR